MRRPSPVHVLFSTLLLCLTPLWLAADTAPDVRPFSARYELTRNGISVGETLVNLQLQPDQTYLYRARTEPTALLALWREDLILEESKGGFVDGGIRPDQYLYQRQGDTGSRRMQLDFDWQKLRVRIHEQGSNWSLSMPAQTLDKLAQQWAFIHHLRQGGGDISYRVADGGRLKDYRYKVLGRDTLQTPLGLYETLKVDRYKGPGSADYTLWLAPELDYQPVRILRRHQGNRYRMDLTEFKWERSVVEQAE